MHFREIVARLAQAHAVPADKLSAFSNRVSNLQRMGWPAGTNTGRGIAADWQEKHYKELFFVMELCAIGIPPERSVEIVKANLALLHSTADAGGSCILHCPPIFGGRVPKTVIKIDLALIRPA